MLCAIGFATLLVSPRRWLRWPALVVTQIGQTTPMPLLMFFGYVLAGGLTDYTASVAVGVSILILGVYNGCYASRAIAEVRRTAGRPEGVVAEGEMARATPSQSPGPRSPPSRSMRPRARRPRT
jgi:hypothetical protein